MKKSMASGIFVTGTDTGVGKTYVASGIAEALCARNVNVGVMKPSETGCRVRSGRLVPKDGLRLMSSARVRDSLSLVSPYLFKKPLAPSVAAEQEGKNINPVKIFKAFDVLSKRHDFMIVEGSGGILVPLSGRYTYLDFAKELGLPVLIVARPGLGTINHTLLTVSALRQCKLNIAGIVINHALDQKSGLTERTSPNVIENLSGIKILDIIQNGYRDFNNLLNKLT